MVDNLMIWYKSALNFQLEVCWLVSNWHATFIIIVMTMFLRCSITITTMSFILWVFSLYEN